MKKPGREVLIAGKYLLERELAAGGMGSVWVGRHLDLDKEVAVKFMDPSCATPEGRIRFEREAKAAACLQSPHVVAVSDYGLDDDLPYIVMELLKGEDLEERLDRQGRLSLEEASDILTQASKALRRAQELGIVHRDLKPHNLFLAKGVSDGDESEETLKILDFGIAKETGPALVGGATQTGELMGSPHYMSPEHVRGVKDIDHRSDLWSLGVIIFRAVTGRLPFDSENVGDVIGKILADPIPKPTTIAPDLPPAVDDYFARALSRDRNQRFQTAKEMADVFAELVRSPEAARISLDRLSSNPGKAPPPSAVPATTASLPALSDTAGEGTVTKASALAAPISSPKSGSSAVLKGIAAGLAIVIAAGATVLVLAFSNGAPPSAAETPTNTTASPLPSPTATAAAAPQPTVAPVPTVAAVDTSPNPTPSAPNIAAVNKPGGKPASSTAAATSAATSKTAAPKSSGPKKNWGF